MKIAIVLIGSAGILACSTLASQAAVVCNEEGDCWKTTERYEYKPEFKVTIHEDDWKLDEKKYRMREDRDEHKKRGYYKSGVWIGF